MADGGPPPAPDVRPDFRPDAGNARAFRDALGRFATGVTLVTVAGPDGPLGFVANSFSSLSLDPPLVLWSIARSARRFPPFAAAERFAIHILGQAQADWPARFARDGAGFAGLTLAQDEAGVPVVPGTPCRFDCDRHAVHDGGDHLILIGRVRRVVPADGAPLVFFQGRYGAFAAAG